MKVCREIPLTIRRKVKNVNILITSIGQRGYLIEHFRKSARGKYGVYAADATKYAPALQNADKSFIIPMAKDPCYYPELLQICKKNEINGIISINDLELPVLANYKEDLSKHGIMAVISSPEVIDLCFDKYKTYEFCRNNGIPVPRTYSLSDREILLHDISSGTITFPIIAKPRKGSRSVGIHLVNTLKQLLNAIDETGSNNIPEDEKIIFQEYIDSEQYSVHVFNDASLKPVSVVTMVNLFKHFGETFHIKTYRDEPLVKLGIQIGETLQHFGPLSADVHKKDSGEYVLLEFNPRISGCYSLSHYAGADYPGKIYKLLRNENIPAEHIDEFKDGVIMLKQFTTMQLTEEIISEKVRQ